MNVKEYPLLRVLIEDIEFQQENQRPLALILLVGVANELILREIMDDSKTLSISRVLRAAIKHGSITAQEVELFEEIIEIRNRYIHINAQKIYDTSYWVLDENSTLIEDITELVRNDWSEDSLLQVFEQQTIIDARSIYKDFYRLLEKLEARA